MTPRYLHASAPQRWNIPAPSRTRKLWSYVEAVPYQLQTWWRNAKRRIQWRSYKLERCDSCDGLQLAYRVAPVFARCGLVTYECIECREASAFARLIIRHLENK